MTDNFGIQDLSKPGPEKYAPKTSTGAYPTFPAGNESINAIKDNLKKLTHRQMREMVKEIFSARDNLATKDRIDDDTIVRLEMADVLDRFAHGN